LGLPGGVAGDYGYPEKEMSKARLKEDRRRERENQVKERGRNAFEVVTTLLKL